MSNTINGIAKDIGVSRMSIIRKMNKVKDFDKKYTHKDPKNHNKITINDKGVKILKSFNYRTNYGRKSKAHKQKIESERNQKRAKNDSINVLKARNDGLKALLNAYKSQLHATREDLNKTHTELSHQQELQIAGLNRIKKYQATIGQYKDRIKHLKSLPPSSNSGNNNQKSFWKRFLSKL